MNNQFGNNTIVQNGEWVFWGDLCVNVLYTGILRAYLRGRVRNSTKILNPYLLLDYNRRTFASVFQATSVQLLF